MGEDFAYNQPGHSKFYHEHAPIANRYQSCYYHAQTSLPFDLHDINFAYWKIMLGYGFIPRIGRAVAISLARAGGNVAIGFREDELGADTTQRICGEFSMIVQCDVADPADCQRVIGDVYDRFGSVDIVVNNAAISPRGSFSMPYEAWVSHWRQTFEADLMSVVNIPFCAVELMKRQHSGKIINISPRSAFRGETAYFA
ncbi:MAG: fabG 7 [Bacteroidetes bacterium]|nr:fabG 7 [Bacteroidota bacterium]